MTNYAWKFLCVKKYIKFPTKLQTFFHCIDLNAQDSVGNTPLHLCVQEDAFDAMDFLLSMYDDSNESEHSAQKLTFFHFFLLYTARSVQIY